MPYLVVEKLKNLPVYRLKPESGMGSVRTLHRDHILPIGDEVRLAAPAQSMDHLAPPETRARSVKRKQRNGLGGTSVTLMDNNRVGDSESEEELCYFTQTGWKNSHKPRAVSVYAFCGKEATYSENDLPGPSANDTVPLLPEEVLEESNPAEAGDPDLEGGESHRESARRDAEELVPARPKREVRPVVKLNYDRLGQPTSRPQTLVRRGMVINGEDNIELRKNPATQLVSPISSVSPVCSAKCFASTQSNSPCLEK